MSGFYGTVHYVGDSGNAQKLKIINNLAESINLICGAEIVNLACSLGFKIDTVYNVLTTARGKSDYMTLLLNRLRTHEVNVGVPLAVRLKDLMLGIELIRENGFNSILSSDVLEIFQKTYSLYGSNADQSMCFETIKMMASRH